MSALSTSTSTTNSTLDKLGAIYTSYVKTSACDRIPFYLWLDMNLFIDSYSSQADDIELRENSLVRVYKPYHMGLSGEIFTRLLDYCKKYSIYDICAADIAQDPGFMVTLRAALPMILLFYPADIARQFDISCVLDRYFEEFYATKLMQL